MANWRSAVVETLGEFRYDGNRASGVKHRSINRRPFVFSGDRMSPIRQQSVDRFRGSFFDFGEFSRGNCT
jgi:hypothetical protein